MNFRTLEACETALKVRTGRLERIWIRYIVSEMDGLVLCSQLTQGMFMAEMKGLKRTFKIQMANG